MTIELRGDSFRAFPLTSDHGPALQRLLEEAADYSKLVLGRPPGPAEAESVFSAGPVDGSQSSNKMLYGIARTDSDEMIGVLDGFRDFPKPRTWYIGLLLFSPRARGGGIGRAVVEAFADAAQAGGAHELQLNVVEQNEVARRFWTACGFVEVRRWRQHLGEKDSTFIRMRRPL